MIKAKLYFKLSWVFVQVSYFLKTLAVRSDYRQKLYMARGVTAATIANIRAAKSENILLP